MAWSQGALGADDASQAGSSQSALPPAVSVRLLHTLAGSQCGPLSKGCDGPGGSYSYFIQLWLRMETTLNHF